ncbi:MAG: YihY/virulence factor BrkB family protein [Saprospiraceae bacterium]
MKSLRFYWNLLLESFNKFSEDNIMGQAAALSYYTIFSLPPMLLVIMYTTTIFYDKAEIQRAIFTQISELVGADGATQLSNTLDKVGLFEGDWWQTAIGIGALLFTSTTVFVTIQNALNNIFRVKPKPRLGWLKMATDRLISFTTLLGIAFILLVSLSINAIVSAFGEYLSQWLPDISLLFVSIINFFLPLIIITLLFALLFKYLPDAKLDWSETWIGAVITAILFTVGKYAIAFYIGNSETANLYDAAGSVLVIMVWVFYASAIFLFGAVFTYVYAKALSDGIQPSSYAVRIEQREIEIDKK